MARKTSNPALYELLGERPGRPKAARAHPEPPRKEQETAAQPFGWLSPGRTVRLPIGWVLLAIAGTITLLAGAYVVGHARGERLARLEVEQDRLAQADTRWSIPPPEAVRQPPIEATPLATTPADDEAAADPGPELLAEPARPPTTSASVVIEPDGGPPDPREAGLNYFVLIHTKRANAIKLAEFCREQGLEAYAIRAKNLNLYKVVVLPGYRRGERTSKDVRALERHIVDVARRWNLQVSSRDDLAYYPERYDG